MNEASDIAHIIQLSVAPVFLLAGIGAILGVVTARLGRVIDRARLLETASQEQPSQLIASRIREELATLDRRIVYAQRAIYLSTIAALLVCLVVSSLFIGALVQINLSAAIALLFVAAMLCLIGGLSLFLVEVAIATRCLRVRSELLMK